VRESFVTMMPAFKFTSCALAAMLLVLSSGSEALTLGRARGAAIVAQPLSLSVSITAAVDEDVSDICFEADVFYGDNKVDSSRVTVSVDTPVAGQTWQVRVLSKLPIDEPVVTLHLRSTCAAKTSRRYVLLADVASELTPMVPALAQSANVAANLAGKPQPVDMSASKGTEKAVGARASVSSNGAQSNKAGSRVVPSSQASAVASPPKKASTGKSRLKLAPLDLAIERDPSLKASPELLSSPSDDMQKRGEAAALWRALNLTPDDVLRDAARLQGLEKSVQKLSETSGLNQRQIKDLMARLETSESERYRNPVVVGLGAAVLLMLGGGIWLYRRQQRERDGNPWWRGDADLEIGPDSSLEAAARVTSASAGFASRSEVTTKLVPSAPPNGSASGESVDIDLDLGFADQPSVAYLSATGAVDGRVLNGAQATTSGLMGLRDFSHSLSGGLRTDNTQEMLDIRQQAEFFMTLGQYDDAIALLEGHVADSADFNPSVHLDLLKIFHTLSRKEEFDRYRREFNAVFTGQVPEYGGFLTAGKGLEAYPELCDQLVRLWPSREAMAFMESSLVRQRSPDHTQLVELEAFKDLLLLHAVCGRLVDALDGVPATFSTSKAIAQELQVLHTGPAPIDATLPELSQAMLSEVDLELDIPDLEPVVVNAAVNNLIDFDVSGFTSDHSKSGR
jgi:hypothetical protein